MNTTETIKALRDALRKAYNFGQTYWQQADSEYLSQQRKSNETADKFATFVDETCAALTADASEDAPRQITYCEEEWITKTDWVQADFQKELFPLAYLGQHRADIMRDEIARLRRVIAHSAPVGQQAGAVDGDASCQ